MIPIPKTLVAFATRWGPQFGGINSFNADLLPAVAAAFGNKVKTICVVLDASTAEVDAARSENVSLVSLDLPSTKKFSAELETKVSQALQSASIEPNTAERVWLGHDLITGEIALTAAKKFGGRSALIHHMSYKHYEVFAENSAQASSKLTEQKQLFVQADIVLAVGPLLRDALSDMLDGKEVPMLVPGFPEITHRTEPRTFNAFLSGRLDDSARKIKQAYLGVAAFGEAISRCSLDYGLPDALHRNNEPYLVLRGVDFEKSDGTIDPQAEQDLKAFAEQHAKGVLTMLALPFTKDREELFNDLRAASVAMMPSWHEGFGLVAWEAIAAGVPLIVSTKSGAYRLLCEFQNGLYTSLVHAIEIAGSNQHPYFQSNDLKTLADALIEIAKDPAKHRQKAAELYRGLKAYYSWERCAIEISDALGWDFSCGPATIESSSISPTPTMRPTANLLEITNLDEIRNSFASTSAIGRSWHRDIAGERISNPIVKKLLAAIDEKKSSILLTGLPGSGKTCVMLALQEALEQRANTHTDLVPLFIQSREFTDQVNSQERQAQGLSELWVEKVARMAEVAQVVVVIDSLDVLSIAREHRVLTYFLAQIDRLILIPNVTVITACRDFDRHYDRRIAVRKWDVELKCQALNWETEIVPLLSKLNIDTSNTDAVTRELIRNPRELALFVELSQQTDNVNAVTSQALSQRYLKTIVRDNISLGEPAMEAIEAIANEMLKTRSLAVPRQSFKVSTETLKALLSHNVLRETQDEKLVFGHQTLMDVLVISGAVRQGVTLNSFIENLPQVPFVRPSIRSFVAQLAIGERNTFRKQLRTVLIGKAPFHIRRLVAESFAEQKPEDDDWALINDLRKTHRDVFQVIYTQANAIEWHHFWLKNLVPLLKNARDVEGITAHAYRISQWKNEDAEGVLSFWISVLKLDWVDKKQIAGRLGFFIQDIHEAHIAKAAPLVKTILELANNEDSFMLGIVLARCVIAGSADDVMLWRFVTGEIADSDALKFKFGDKLRCQPHEFGNSEVNFLQLRMQESIVLLNLAVASIEKWSHIKISNYGGTDVGYWCGFLRETSYSDTHSKHDHLHIDSERMLFDMVEVEILTHAKANSDWWLNNRKRLCSNSEGALRYFAILACTASPEANIDLIEKMLCDNQLLKSDLSYEMGTLLQAAFIYLAPPAQDAILKAILSLREEETGDDISRSWVLYERAQLIVTIPGYLRSPKAQALLDAQEKAEGYLIRQPSIGMRGGMVGAPFSYEVFLNASDGGVLRLLAHYTGQSKSHGDDFLIGGEREVGWQLREAASRQPTRFLHMLPAHWANISKGFRDDIMDGVANYLAHRFGNLQTQPTWKPLEEPNAPALAEQILDELERHPSHWQFNRSASSALQACAHVITESQAAERLVFLAIGFESIREESSIGGDSIDLMTTGINMVQGHIVEALMILANQLLEKSTVFPELLLATIRRFATNKHPAIQALILRRLAFFQSRMPELGWDIFNSAMLYSQGLWESAESCLYYAYHDHFERVAPLLPRIRDEGKGKDLEIWARISALAALAGLLNFSVFLEELKVLDATEAWQGAATVWTHPENFSKHRDQCLSGIEAGLNARNAHAAAVAGQMDQIFRDKFLVFSVPTALIKRYFDVLKKDNENKHHRVMDFDAWLNRTSQHDPEKALADTEIYLAFVKLTKSYLYDFESNLTQLITRLFSAAEEREEFDHGSMLKRVVAVQDALLGLGVDGINEWLKAAERP